jgi:hypothetical protein
VWRSQAEHERVLKGARSGNKRKGSNAGQGAAAGRAKKQRTGQVQVGGNPANRNKDRGLAPLCQNLDCIAPGVGRGNCGNGGWQRSGKPAWKPLCDRCTLKRKQDPAFARK